MANYSLGRKPIPDVPNGHRFVGDNFCQLLPHTEILEGKTGLIFENCNLTNCDLPHDAVFVGCFPCHVEFCSNIHKHFIDAGLTPCVEACSHSVDSDVVTIDGQAVGTTYHYQDAVVS